MYSLLNKRYLNLFMPLQCSTQQSQTTKAELKKRAIYLLFKKKTFDLSSDGLAD